MEGEGKERGMERGRETEKEREEEEMNERSRENALGYAWVAPFGCGWCRGSQNEVPSPTIPSRVSNFRGQRPPV